MIPTTSLPAAANVNAAPVIAKTFEVGKTYWTRSVCDADCIIEITIAKRTAKFITTTEGKRLGVSSAYGTGDEMVKPWGTYSMCPIITADKIRH